MTDPSILPLLQNQHLWCGADVIEKYKLTASVHPLMNCSQRLEKGAS